MLAYPILRYDEPLYRPPSEGRNLIIQATLGCSFNRYAQALGTVALDGTKILANASRHSALSYEHAGKIEGNLVRQR